MTDDGGFVVWDKSARVPLPLAVTASCAVPILFPAHTPSTATATWMAACAPPPTPTWPRAATASSSWSVTARLPGQAAPLEAEAGRLRVNDHRVEVIIPDDAICPGLWP